MLGATIKSPKTGICKMEKIGNIEKPTWSTLFMGGDIKISKFLAVAGQLGLVLLVINLFRFEESY